MLERRTIMPNDLVIRAMTRAEVDELVSLGRPWGLESRTTRRGRVLGGETPEPTASRCGHRHGWGLHHAEV